MHLFLLLDIESFLKRCATKKCQSMEITATCVEYTDSVLVQGDMSEVSDDALMLYLTNKKRSRGGEVKSSTWDDRRKSVVVAFEDCHGMCIIILVSGQKNRFSWPTHYQTMNESFTLMLCSDHKLPF